MDRFFQIWYFERNLTIGRNFIMANEHSTTKLSEKLKKIVCSTTLVVVGCQFCTIFVNTPFFGRIHAVVIALW